MITFKKILVHFFAVFLASNQLALAETTAFPGAVGYGRFADGWKGGKYIPVTTLADQGPGSLRACAELGPQPKICGFKISGTIYLDAPIHVSPNTYIAGQTAPGSGIELRLGATHLTPLVIKNASDVIVRYLKIRPGRGIMESANIDAVTVENAERVYLDHLSMMFASDETLNLHVANGRTADVTIANSILAYSLDDAGHPKGRHSKGALICSDEGVRQECGRVTLWQNLFAHNRDRNPDIKGTPVGPIEVINNVFYNPISQFGEIYNLLGDVEIVYRGNLALAGPNTIERTPEAVQVFEWTDSNKVRLTASDNLAIDRGRCDQAVAFNILDPAAQAATHIGPPTLAVAPVSPADDTLAIVLSGAGDWRPGLRERDLLDSRVVSDVLNCQGAVIDDPSNLGAWPDLAKTMAPPDSDADGFPDSWERTVGSDPNNLSPHWGPSGKYGLSLVEFWLAKLAGDLR